MYICQCCSLSPSHPLLLLLCPHVHSIRLHLCSCPGHRSICTPESEVLSWDNPAPLMASCTLMHWTSWNVYALLGPGEAETGTGGRYQALRTAPVLLWRVGDIFTVCSFGLLVSYCGGRFHLKPWLCINGEKSLCALLVCVTQTCPALCDPVGWFSGQEYWSGLPCSSPGTLFTAVAVESFSCVWLFATPWTVAHRDPMDCSTPRPPCPSPSPGACSYSCPLSRWCHPTISFSVIPFSFCPQSFPASGSFPVSQLFASGGQRIGASASASVLQVNIQHWIPLGWTGFISLQCKGLSPTLCDPMDYSLPGFSVHGIVQARVLEWVAISLSRGSSWSRSPAM